MTTIATGNRRLLKLADILDKADALHKRRKEPTYNQFRTVHSCGTPACAIGHWAAANPKSWEVSVGYISHKTITGGFGEAAKSDFAITDKDVDELFEGDGCGEARTGKQAATYIRAFVKRRSAK